MRELELLEVINQQQSVLNTSVSYKREILSEVEENVPEFVKIISGIRRCGKSTLLSQLIRKEQQNHIFLNFDSPKMYDFTIKDFSLLDKIITQRNIKSLFFDEIQVINGWETYIREKLELGYNVTVTGSNASMLSQELGTRLTGRHITKELFPFSYNEFCGFKNLQKDSESLEKYLHIGGFPQYVKTENDEILFALLEDILYRDIVVRYGVKDAQSLRNLLIYLIGNIGNLITATKLTSVTGIKTAKTVLDYFSFFEQSYIISFVAKFSYSYKSQMISPKKVYCIDNGLHAALSPSFLQDKGRRLENMVYTELRRKYKQIYYYNNNSHECDFVICEKNVPTKLYQVCYELNHDNEEREVSGLLQAMNDLKIQQGQILTFNQQDTISSNGNLIEVLPVYKCQF